MLSVFSKINSESDMNIPDPVLIPVNINLSHLSWWKQFLYTLKNPPKYALGEDYIITLDNGVEIVCEKGTVLDLASVPRIFWFIPGFSPVGPLRYGAIPHDIGYRNHCLFTRNVEGDIVRIYIGYSQDFYDRFLREITIEKTGIKFVANVAYKALRRFGHITWNKYRANGTYVFNPASS